MDHFQIVLEQRCPVELFIHAAPLLPVSFSPELVTQSPDRLPLQDHLVPLREGPIPAALGHVRLQARI